MMTAQPRTMLLAAFLLTAAFAHPALSSDDKCTIATKGDSVVAKACASGGRKDAKKLMKEMVKTAKAKGTKFTCDSCHKDLEKYELTADARGDFKKLLAAAGQK